VADSPQGARYRELADKISESLAFMAADRRHAESHPSMHQVDFFTSHEALLLGYEEAMTRIDSTSGQWYDTSAHLVWIGERTRELGGAHVEFFRGIKNPIGVKCGPTMEADDILRLADVLNPQNEPGRLTLYGASATTRSRGACRGLLDATAATAATWSGPSTRCTATR
jgi:3-deoxy-7-phosphoheptulonate synthase